MIDIPTLPGVLPPQTTAPQTTQAALDAVTRAADAARRLVPPLMEHPFVVDAGVKGPITVRGLRGRLAFTTLTVTLTSTAAASLDAHGVPGLHLSDLLTTIGNRSGAGRWQLIRGGRFEYLLVWATPGFHKPLFLSARHSADYWQVLAEGPIRGCWEDGTPLPVFGVFQHTPQPREEQGLGFDPAQQAFFDAPQAVCDIVVSCEGGD